MAHSTTFSLALMPAAASSDWTATAMLYICMYFLLVTISISSPLYPASCSSCLALFRSLGYHFLWWGV